MTDTNTNTTIVSAPSTTPPTRLDALERYGRSAGSLYGELLKFSGKTGAWTSGAQGLEVPIGTQLVAIVPEMLAGFVKWQDGELVEQVMQPITETYDPKQLRSSLGDTDHTRWPIGDDGEPEDPWREGAAEGLEDGRRVHLLHLVGWRHPRGEAPRRDLRLAVAGCTGNHNWPLAGRGDRRALVQACRPQAWDDLQPHLRRSRLGASFGGARQERHGGRQAAGGNARVPRLSNPEG